MSKQEQERQAIWNILEPFFRQYHIFVPNHVERLSAEIQSRLAELNKPSDDLVQKILSIMDDTARADESNAEFLLGGDFAKVATEIASLFNGMVSKEEMFKFAEFIGNDYYKEGGGSDWSEYFSDKIIKTSDIYEQFKNRKK